MTRRTELLPPALITLALTGVLAAAPAAAAIQPCNERTTYPACRPAEECWNGATPDCACTWDSHDYFDLGGEIVDNCPGQNEAEPDSPECKIWDPETYPEPFCTPTPCEGRDSLISCTDNGWCLEWRSSDGSACVPGSLGCAVYQDTCNCNWDHESVYIDALDETYCDQDFNDEYNIPLCGIQTLGAEPYCTTRTPVTCPGDPSCDADGDGIVDADDPCPVDPENDADSDGICEVDDNCDLVANSDQSDLDGDGLGDVCDDDIDGDGVLNASDICTGGVSVTKPQLKFTKLTAPGSQGLQVKGTGAFAGAVPIPPVDVSALGMRVEIVDLGAGNAVILDHTIPAGLVPNACGPKDGWKVNGRGTSEKFSTITDSLPPGCAANSADQIPKASVNDKTAAGKGVQHALQGKNGTFGPIVGPFRVTVVYGGGAESAAGQCSVVTFAGAQCVLNSRGTTMTCK